MGKKHTYAPDRPKSLTQQFDGKSPSVTWIQIHGEKVINSHGEN
jgi:hypothetical protein